MKGYIQRRSYAICKGGSVACLREIQVRDTEDSQSYLRLQGWSYTNQYGWLCPACRVYRRNIAKRPSILTPPLQFPLEEIKTNTKFVHMLHSRLEKEEE